MERDFRTYQIYKMKRDKKLKKLVEKLEDAVKLSKCQAPSPHTFLSGFDKDYKLNKKGEILESLIDKFFIN